ncbi:MAG: rod shape-determining protein RodA [Firmicutes bacterium]|nr:rod shape-determining protein RodA [Bacillota bacterium]
MTAFTQTIKKYDITLIATALIASLLGIVFIYSATKSFESNFKFIFVQSGALILGLVIMYVITKIDYEDISHAWPLAAAGSVLLLILVLLIGTGSESTGTQGWIRFWGIGIQPAEITKVFFIITMSTHLSRIDSDINYIKNIFLLLLHLCAPVVLIMLQPDMGTVFVYIFIFILMVFIAGIDWRYLMVSGGALSIVSVCAWFFFLSQYQKNRFFAFLNPESAPTTYGYHVMQSKIAIGSGQLLGKGFLKGIQTQLGILPEKQTDFIYAVIGEETGLIGCAIILTLMITLIVRCILIGKKAKNPLGTYICVGIAAMWLFHAFENIGMTIGITPVTGIPLPFISYGGSSLVTNFMALGLVLNVKMREKTLSFQQ